VVIVLAVAQVVLEHALRWIELQVIEFLKHEIENPQYEESK
jgi:hypothetical protein